MELLPDFVHHIHARDKDIPATIAEVVRYTLDFYLDAAPGSELLLSTMEASMPLTVPSVGQRLTIHGSPLVTVRRVEGAYEIEDNGDAVIKTAVYVDQAN